MALQPGTQLGAYRILAPPGAGGMGEVYGATDTRLNRDVAIKVLPAAFANDAGRLLRFEVEARTTSVLNHSRGLTRLAGKKSRRPMADRSRSGFGANVDIGCRLASEWGGAIELNIG